MAYCLSLLSYTNEKSLQKLIECFKLFADALADDEVAEFFSNIVEETRKNAAAVQQPATAACLLIILYYYFSNYLFSHNQKYISRFFVSRYVIVRITIRAITYKLFAIAAITPQF